MLDVMRAQSEKAERTRLDQRSPIAFSLRVRGARPPHETQLIRSEGGLRRGTLQHGQPYRHAPKVLVRALERRAAPFLQAKHSRLDKRHSPVRPQLRGLVWKLASKRLAAGVRLS